MVPVLVTPELARWWLDRAAANRALDGAAVGQYARDMARGHWRPLQGSALEFDAEGRLLNGQHRLLAIVLSGVSVPLQASEQA